MSKERIAHYFRLRSLGWNAVRAMHAARIAEDERIDGLEAAASSATAECPWAEWTPKDSS